MNRESKAGAPIRTQWAKNKKASYFYAPARIMTYYSNRY